MWNKRCKLLNETNANRSKTLLQHIAASVCCKDFFSFTLSKLAIFAGHLFLFSLTMLQRKKFARSKTSLFD